MENNVKGAELMINLLIGLVLGSWFGFLIAGLMSAARDQNNDGEGIS